MSTYDWAAESRKQYTEMLTELYFDEHSALHLLRTNHNTCLFLDNPDVEHSFDAHEAAMSACQDVDCRHVTGEIYGLATYMEDWFFPNMNTESDGLGSRQGVFVLTNIAKPFFVIGESGSGGFLGGSLPFDSIDKFSTPELVELADEVSRKMKAAGLTRAKKEELNEPLPYGIKAGNYSGKAELLVFDGYFNTIDDPDY